MRLRMRGNIGTVLRRWRMPLGICSWWAETGNGDNSAADSRGLCSMWGLTTPEPWCESALALQLARLSDRERLVVMLVNGFQWSLAEVAELLDVSKSTVQTHAERGMAKLRSGMGVTA